ncbi:hypothetical protein ElyMa_002154900 [Elysia marginata]|uniref:Peptidase S8/S53 domain-containing protein n=1 Tax=Elysia marginata TaxID=1093978 RepID=A0AAV4FM10_9GAST|nr:hypothetical protein ElyMa_002154900 [Elysia marginata]
MRSPIFPDLFTSGQKVLRLLDVFDVQPGRSFATSCSLPALAAAAAAAVLSQLLKHQIQASTIETPYQFTCKNSSLLDNIASSVMPTK